MVVSIPAKPHNHFPSLSLRELFWLLKKKQKKQDHSFLNLACLSLLLKLFMKLKLLCKSTMSYLFSSATDQSSGWCWWAGLAYALLLTNGDQKWSLKWKALVQVEKPCTSGTQHTPLLHCSQALVIFPSQICTCSPTDDSLPSVFRTQDSGLLFEYCILWST